jgi:hypothetical protein
MRIKIIKKYIIIILLVSSYIFWVYLAYQNLSLYTWIPIVALFIANFLMFINDEENKVNNETSKTIELRKEIFKLQDTLRNNKLEADEIKERDLEGVIHFENRVKRLNVVISEEEYEKLHLELDNIKNLNKNLLQDIEIQNAKSAKKKKAKKK